MDFSAIAMVSHSLNDRGELAAYVNPHTCSCVTCTNYIAANEPLRWPEAANEPRPSSPELLLPEPAAETELRWGGEPSTPLRRPLAISIPPAPRLVRVNAFAPRSARTEEDELLVRLRRLREQLLEDATRSHGEMASEELEEKINVITELLRVFDPLDLRSLQ